MAARAILFDLDGTIWDSYPWYAAVLENETGVAAAETLRLLRAGASVVMIARNCGVAGSKLRRLCESCSSTLRVYPGVGDSLDKLKQRRWNLGIVTSLPERVARPLLDGCGLTNMFGAIVHANNCTYRKPRPEPLLLALQQVQAGVLESWYVGDRSVDALAADNAGMQFAWASYGYVDGHPRAAFELKSFRDVLDL